MATNDGHNGPGLGGLPCAPSNGTESGLRRAGAESGPELPGCWIVLPWAALALLIASFLVSVAIWLDAGTVEWKLPW